MKILGLALVLSLLSFQAFADDYNYTCGEVTMSASDGRVTEVAFHGKPAKISQKRTSREGILFTVRDLKGTIFEFGPCADGYNAKLEVSTLNEPLNCTCDTD